MEVVGEAADGAEAIDLARVHRPHVVLMGMRMPGTGGPAATSAICADPGPAAVRVLILTTFEIDEYVAQALRAGAGDFMGKDVTADVLLDGIRTVAAGESLVSPAATRRLITRRTHVHRAMTKPGARDRAQLVVMAYQSGLVRAVPPNGGQ